MHDRHSPMTAGVTRSAARSDIRRMTGSPRCAFGTIRLRQGRDFPRSCAGGPCLSAQIGPGRRPSASGGPGWRSPEAASSSDREREGAQCRRAPPRSPKPQSVSYRVCRSSRFQMISFERLCKGQCPSRTGSSAEIAAISRRCAAANEGNCSGDPVEARRTGGPCRGDRGGCRPKVASLPIGIERAASRIAY